MPGFNGKGPQNEGPRTGRGLGKCKPASETKPKEGSNELKIEEGNRFEGRGLGLRKRQGAGFNRRRDL